MIRTLARERARVVSVFVKMHVDRFLTGSRSRPCANCGRLHTPKQRWNFLCSDECRREWRRGQFRPRTPED